MEFAQVTTTPPENLLTLLWIIIGVLTGVIVYLYKTKESERKDCLESKEELMLKMISGLQDVDKSLDSIASLIEAWQSQFETMSAIRDLAERIDRRGRKSESEN